MRGRRCVLQKVIFLSAIAIIQFSFSAPVAAYETIEIKDGGSIEGVVEYAGKAVPQDPLLTISTEAAYCGKSIPAKRYLIKDRKIKNVIVYLAEVKSGRAVPNTPVTVTNLQCEFMPHVAIAFAGSTITMKNDDPMLHTFDVHASLSGAELFHFSLHEKGSSVTKTLSNAGLLEISCYIHPWQHAFVYVFDHPYAAITDENGKFVIRGVPPGTYTIEAWHEALGIQKIPDVKVRGGRTSVVKLEYTKEMTLY